jgi:hypothetical protein
LGETKRNKKEREQRGENGEQSNNPREWKGSTRIALSGRFRTFLAFSEAGGNTLKGNREARMGLGDQYEELFLAKTRRMRMFFAVYGRFLH